MTYNAVELNDRMMSVFRSRYPNFNALRLIFSSDPGGGKSVVLASVPVSEEKMRIAFDNEDSMAYIDAGKEGVDVYTPRTQQFRLHRIAFPTMEDYASYFQSIQKTPEKVGAVLIDNIAILQDILVSFLAENASKPQTIRTIYSKMGAASALPNDGLIKTWVRNHDGLFWKCAKEPAKQLVMLCMKNGIHFVGSTEEGNVWVNYGKPQARIIGKKAKIWDVWYRYTDGVISLARDANTTNPPEGSLYPNQPKMRLQGLNPKFTMDWKGFIDEVEAASKRTEEDIPKDAQIIQEEVFEEA